MGSEGSRCILKPWKPSGHLRSCYDLTILFPRPWWINDIFSRWVFLKNDLPRDNCGKVDHNWFPFDLENLHGVFYNGYLDPSFDMCLRWRTACHWICAYRSMILSFKCSEHLTSFRYESVHVGCISIRLNASGKWSFVSDPYYPSPD